MTSHRSGKPDNLNWLLELPGQRPSDSHSPAQRARWVGMPDGLCSIDAPYSSTMGIVKSI